MATLIRGNQSLALMYRLMFIAKRKRQYLDGPMRLHNYCTEEDTKINESQILILNTELI